MGGNFVASFNTEESIYSPTRIIHRERERDDVDDGV